MDFVAYGTLVAAVIAAIAAVWSSVVSQRQLNLTRDANASPLPVVNATLTQVEGQTAWTKISVRLTNRSDVPLLVLSLKIERPKHSRLLSSDDAVDDPTHYNPKFLNPLPLDRAKDEIDIGHFVGAIGSTRFESKADLTFFNVYAHRSGEHVSRAETPQLAMKLQWQDHEASIFHMTVNVIRA